MTKTESASCSELIKQLLDIYNAAPENKPFHLYPILTGAFIGIVGMLYKSISLSMLLINLGWFYTKPVLEWAVEFTAPNNPQLPFASSINNGMEWVKLHCVEPCIKLFINILNTLLGIDSQYTIFYLIVFTVIISVILFYVTYLTFYLGIGIISGVLIYHIFIHGYFPSIPLNNIVYKTVVFVILMVIIVFGLIYIFNIVFIILFATVGQAICLSHIDLMFFERCNISNFYYKVMTNKIIEFDNYLGMLFISTSIIFGCIQFYLFKRKK